MNSESFVTAKPAKDCGNCGNSGIFIAVFVLFVLLIILPLIFFTAMPCGNCSEKFADCNCGNGFNNTRIKKDMFHDISLNVKPLGGKEHFQIPNMPRSLNYNANYTSPDVRINGGFIYTQPPGDVRAQAFGHSGQGTSGEFFPLQGNGAPTMMKNSSPNNLAVPSSDPGMIGGQDNYTTKMFTAGFNGFQNFGSPFAFQEGVPAIFDENYSNSYLITGGNQRVRNPGESKQGNRALECGNWWPTVGGTNCVSGNSDLAGCNEGNLGMCARFVESKMKPRWESVLENSM